MSAENTPQPTEEETQVTSQVLDQIHEEEAAQRKTQARHQYINFGVLVVILLGVVLVVGLSAPTISQKLVGAIMGENLTSATLAPESSDEIKEPPTEEVPNGEETAPSEQPVDGSETTTDDAAENVTETTESEPAAPEPQTHQVQAGETLFAISRQYNLTIEDLIRANNITTPNNIPVGTVLVIPQP